MTEIIKQLLTGKDNQTHDVIRWLAVLAIVVALGLQIHVVAILKTQAFDMQAFGIGLGAVFTAVGAALKLKEGSEPS
jgi:hypothetical protein